LGLGIIIGRFLSGVMLDRYHGPRVGFALFMIPVFGYLALWSQSAALAPYGVAMVGISLGVEGDILAYFASRYFGLRSYAEIFGWIFGVMAITGACGPVLMLAIPESAGYRPVLLIFSAMAIMSAVLISTLGRYPVWRNEED
jgi:MFS transporter, OFA family, oxalate/formate antiporter